MLRPTAGTVAFRLPLPTGSDLSEDPVGAATASKPHLAIAQDCAATKRGDLTSGTGGRGHAKGSAGGEGGGAGHSRREESRTEHGANLVVPSPG